MEKAIDGFANYHVAEGQIIETATGNVMKPNKKGMAALTNDAGEPQIVNVADVLAALGEGSPFEGGELAPPAEKPAAPAADPIAEKLKELRKGLKEAQAGMMKAKLENLAEAHKAMIAAQEALDAFKAAHPTEVAKSSPKAKAKKEKAEKAPAAPPSAEQIAAQEAYDTAKAAYEVAKKALADAQAHLKTFKSVSDASHAPRMKYEDVQAIRRAYATGRYPEFPGEKKPVSAICEQFGVSESAVGYYVKYQQHKLRRMPEGTDMTQEENILLYTAFTPLVNEYYPATWTSKDGKLVNGAPYAEDGITEDASKYKVKA